MIRDCRQITFVTLNGFCPLSKKTPPAPLQKINANGFSIIVPWNEGLSRFTKLTRWSEPGALVEKNRTSPLLYNFVAARRTVFLKLLFQSYKYQ